MSSWVGGLNADPYRRPGGGLSGNDYRTQCKLGRHAILRQTPARWVTDATLAPLGLSCVACLQARAAELGRVLDLTEVQDPVEVPAPRRTRQVPPPEEWVHGEASTYSNLKCRCDPCRQANSRRSAEYRARRRGVLR